ncbi:hypothetical protein [Endozoicomonas numazuensis]|uniref:Lipocalin-like domain-containing protein n=1 Tax=Endozoicomonas numazuensis TaxID=1137799 RepID=A0A081NIL2_9GAMM|nr:hypothetical protein [Endozoicomonas numazuensis]KEQ18285.1 hypothetical protein GZ78_12240 [Endozoicomonas numazuensis]
MLLSILKRTSVCALVAASWAQTNADPGNASSEPFQGKWDGTYESLQSTEDLGHLDCHCKIDMDIGTTKDDPNNVEITLSDPTEKSNVPKKVQACKDLLPSCDGHSFSNTMTLSRDGTKFKVSISDHHSDDSNVVLTFQFQGSQLYGTNDVDSYVFLKEEK